MSERGRFSLSGVAFAAIAVITELSVIVLVSLITSLGYHFLWYGNTGPMESSAAIGSLTALLYGGVLLLHDAYSVDSIIKGHRSPRRLLFAWTAAFITLIVIGFSTKSTAVFSRGWIFIFFTVGFLVIVGLNGLLMRMLDLLI